eukprot:5228307-Amphidinium_carterae.1
MELPRGVTATGCKVQSAVFLVLPQAAITRTMTRKAKKAVPLFQSAWFALFQMLFKQTSSKGSIQGVNF